MNPDEELLKKGEAALGISPATDEDLLHRGEQLLDPSQQPRKVSEGEAALHGFADAVPLGQRAVAVGRAGMLKLGKLLSEHPDLKAFVSGFGASPTGGVSDVANTAVDIAHNPELLKEDNSYKGSLAHERESLQLGKEQHPNYTLAGQVGGTAATMAIPGMTPFKGLRVAKDAPKLLRLGAAATRIGAGAGNAGIYGALHAAGSSDSGDELLSKLPREAGENALFGAGGSAIGEAVGGVAQKLAPGVKNWSNRLKFKSFEPTPSAIEAARDLPGGIEAVGEQAFQDKVGGLTRNRMRDTSRAARGRADTVMDDLAAAHDARNPTPNISMEPVIQEIEAEARDLVGRTAPDAVAAGNKLNDLAQRARQKYGLPTGGLENTVEAAPQEFRPKTFHNNGVPLKSGQENPLNLPKRLESLAKRRMDMPTFKGSFRDTPGPAALVEGTPTAYGGGGTVPTQPATDALDVKREWYETSRGAGNDISKGSTESSASLGRYKKVVDRAALRLDNNMDAKMPAFQGANDKWRRAKLLEEMATRETPGLVGSYYDLRHGLQLAGPTVAGTVAGAATGHAGAGAGIGAGAGLGASFLMSPTAHKGEAWGLRGLGWLLDRDPDILARAAAVQALRNRKKDEGDTE